MTGGTPAQLRKAIYAGFRVTNRSVGFADKDDQCIPPRADPSASVRGATSSLSIAFIAMVAMTMNANCSLASMSGYEINEVISLNDIDDPIRSDITSLNLSIRRVLRFTIPKIPTKAVPVGALTIYRLEGTFCEDDICPTILVNNFHLRTTTLLKLGKTVGIIPPWHGSKIVDGDLLVFQTKGGDLLAHWGSIGLEFLPFDYGKMNGVDKKSDQSR